MKNLFRLLGIAAVAYLLYYIWTQLPIGSFFWLMAMNIVLIGLIFLFFLGTKNGQLAKGVRVVAVLACGVMCIFSFNRYVNPKSIKIFGNNDHHALAIEGVKLTSPHNFTLVGSSNRAFFDSKDTKGFVTLSALSRDSLVRASVSTDFSALVYERNSNGVYSSIVPSNYEFNAGFDAGKAEGNIAGDKVLLVDENGNQVVFSIVESYRESESLEQKIKNLLGKKSKCARYTLEYAKGDAVDSTYDILRDGTYSTLKTTTKKLKENDTFDFLNQVGQRARLTIAHANDYDPNKKDKSGLVFELQVEGADGNLKTESESIYRSIELKSKKVADGDTFELMDHVGNRALLSILALKGDNKHFRLELVVEAEMRSVVSTFNSFLKQGYPLASMFPANKSEVDLSGVYVVRPCWKRAAKDNELESIYKEPKYRLVFSKQSKIKEVYINGERRQNAVNAELSNISFKTNTIYAIGNGATTFAPFRFKVEDDQTLSLRFQMPMYRMLNAEYMGEQGEDDERSFMIVSTLLDPNGKTLKMLPRNVLLYDFFSHRDNINHIAPSYISFRRDKSDVPLRFSIVTPSAPLNKSYASANADVDNIATTNNANVSWLVDVDNFKDCSAKRAEGINGPYNYKHLVIILMCCIAAALVLVTIRSSAMEGVAHIVLLSFLTIRLFLLWRVSVFPPVEAITINEFNDIFRNTLLFPELGPLSYIIGCLVLFYVVLFVVKLSSGDIVRTLIESPKKFAITSFVLLVAAGALLLKVMGASVSMPLWLSVIVIAVAWVICFGFYLLVRKFRDRPIALTVTLGIFMAVSMILCLWLHYVLNQRIVNILAPISFYFFWDFIVNRFLGKDDGYHSCENEWYRTILTVINIGASFFALFLSDGGYGIMFLAYAIISLIMHLSFVHRLDIDNSRKHWTIVVLYILGAIFIGTYKYILISLFTSLYVWLIVGVALSVIFNFILYVADENYDIWNRRTRIWIASIIVFSFALGGAVNWGFNEMKGSHTEHRVRVLTETPDESLGQMTSLQQERKFLQASLNDWIMGVYVDKGKDVSAVFGENSRGYFKIHPHSKHGALWGAQCTDISVVRFLIAEHGSGMVRLLILLLILMLFSGFMAISDRLAHWKRSLAYQLPLLMLVQALIVYFALTRHFVFIGQDFPMISITSNLTSIMFILIIGLWIYVCNISCGDEQTGRLRSRDYNGRNNLSNRFKYYAELCLFFAIIVAICFICEKSDKRNSEKDVYNVPDCVKALCSTLGTYEGRTGAVAEAFEKYQDHELYMHNKKLGLCTEKDGELVEKPNALRDIRQLYGGQECLRRFCKYVGYDFNNTDTKILESDTSVINRTWLADAKYGMFCRNVFNRFVIKGENNIDALMFLVPKKQTDDDGRAHTRFCFSFNPHYYILQMPNKINDSWSGSVVEQPQNLINRDSVSYKHFDVHILPKEWGDGVNEIKMVKSKSAGVVVVGDTKPTILNSGDVCVLKPSESVLVNEEVADMRRCGNTTYWAKNVLINGVTSFVYPMGDNMFWMYHYAEQVKNNAELKKNNTNVEITLSRSLTEKITKTITDMFSKPNNKRLIKRNDKHCSISAVVANGNGEIWAMVGCNAPRYRVNPNDKQQIKEIEDSLKLIGEYNWGRESERYFANPALISLAHGPGSSQKPLVWTAVSSAYNDDLWKNLSIKNNHFLDRDNKHNVISPFWGGVLLGEKKIDKRAWDEYKNSNDKKTKRGVVVFRSIPGDEGVRRGRNNTYTSAPVDLERYITKSSNYYNAVLVHLGSLPYERLANAFARNTTDSIVRRVRDNMNIQGFDFAQKAFPTIVVGEGKAKSFYYKLQKSDIFDRSSALLTGFANLGLHISDKGGYYRDITARMNISHYLSNSKFGFAYPSASSFLNYMRVGNRAEEHEIVNYGVRQTAIGARSVWEVSPLKMAEMYGRMISLNKGYTLTIHKREPKEVGKEEFVLNNPYMDTYIENRKMFIQGLSNVFTIGTAKKVMDNINSSLREGLFFYAKTGTIDNGKDRDKGRVTDHLLAVVITNKDVKTVEDWDDLKTIRFVVIYLADLGYQYNGDNNWDWETLDASIITEVLKSEEFKNYMFN